MNCIGIALGFVFITCDPPPQPPAVPVARLCVLMTAPVQYARTDDPRTRRQLRSLNAIWRATCQER